MTVEFQWELPGQNVSYGDGLYVTNTTAGTPRVSSLIGFIVTWHFDFAIYPVCCLGVPVECHIH